MLKKILLVFLSTSFLISGCNSGSSKTRSSDFMPSTYQGKLVDDHNKIMYQDKMNDLINKKSHEVEKILSDRKWEKSKIAAECLKIYEIGKAEKKRVVDSGYKKDFEPIWPDIK